MKRGVQACGAVGQSGFSPNSPNSYLSTLEGLHMDLLQTHFESEPVAMQERNFLIGRVGNIIPKSSGGFIRASFHYYYTESTNNLESIRLKDI